ncbi:MAG: transglutaminase family protein [Thermodesulfobacteriota bacterium]
MAAQEQSERALFVNNSLIRRPLIILALLLLLPVASLHASTLILEGRMDGSIDVSQEQRFTVPSGGLKKLIFRYATPTMVQSVSVNQRISGYRANYKPRPAAVDKEIDRFGNKFVVVTWKDLKRDATVSGRFNVKLNISLKEVKSSAPFPLKGVPEREEVFLEPTKLTQADDNRIRALARRLTENAANEQEAVMRILNWVVDNIRYKTPIPHYDAVWTLETRRGNCQNFSHLSIALLRAVGIPARIVGGIALGKPWKVPLENGALVQSIGQGGHAWLEVYYPDLGWVAFDAQQSHLFVSPRHIKQTVGLDSRDINDSWRAAPVLPRFKEEFSADYRTDTIRLVLKEMKESPKNYILTNAVVPHVEAPVEAPLPVRPVPSEDGLVVEFGNMEFPALLQFSTGREGDEVGYKTLDKETAEYVTSEHTYTQAFRIEKALELRKVSLAMHRFGGRLGSLWIDVVKEKDGRPGMEGVRSFPLNLDTVKYTPGYAWFPFTFTRSGDDYPILTPGRYWIILRRSKDAIINWFYIPANPYGDADDTRSTSRGINWSNILNYDFNFKVTGRYRGK